MNGPFGGIRPIEPVSESKIVPLVEESREARLTLQSYSRFSIVTIKKSQLRNAVDARLLQLIARR
jgi:hypothetical protein